MAASVRFTSDSSVQEDGWTLHCMAGGTDALPDRTEPETTLSSAPSTTSPASSSVRDAPCRVRSNRGRFTQGPPRATMLPDRRSIIPGNTALQR